MPNPLTYPVAIELDGIYYISLADDRQFPTYTHSRKIGGAGAAPINITVTLGDSETAPTVGSHIVITVQPQSASRYRTVGGIIMEITQLGSPKRTFQINGLAYEAYLSAVKIPRYSSVNAVTIVTAIEAILTKAYLMGYATDAYDLTTFGDTSATAIVNTDINITAEQAINQVCAQFGFRWYVSTGDWLNKENIGSFIAELVIVKIGYEITGPIDTLDQADIECPPDTMPDVRNVQPTVSIPRPIVVEVASDVESLEAKDQLAELVDVYEIPFLPNSVKRAFIIEIDGVNEVTTVNITSADGSETVSLTINPTPLDPLADPPDFGGFDVLIDTRESRRSILLENDVSSYLASPTTQGFVNGTYTTFRAYGKVTDTTWQGILNTRQVWGDSTTPYFQEQIIEPTAITQTACEALGQSILDAREPYFRKLTFNTTEKGIELLQTITYTNTDLGLSGEKIVITEISENPIDNPDSTELSLGEIIELSVTCEPVPRMTPEQMSIQQAIAVASQPANRPIAAGDGGGGGHEACDFTGTYDNITGDVILDEARPTLDQFSTNGTFDAIFSGVTVDEEYQVRLIIQELITSTGNSADFTLSYGGNEVFTYSRSGDGTDGPFDVIVTGITLAEVTAGLTFTMDKVDTSGFESRFVMTLLPHLTCQIATETGIGYTNPTGDVTIDETSAVDCATSPSDGEVSGTVDVFTSTLTDDVEYTVYVRGQFFVVVNPGDTVTASYSLQTPGGTINRTYSGLTADQTTEVAVAFTATLAELTAGVTLNLSTTLSTDGSLADSFADLQLNGTGHRIKVGKQ